MKETCVRLLQNKRHIKKGPSVPGPFMRDQ
jgi:hypothetical protein